jgi:hypothetical protein
MKRKTITMPQFGSKAEEAGWWASREGRAFVKQKAAESIKTGVGLRGSRLIGKMEETATVQIALRLPQPDLASAREIAARKGIGYQTLLKMLVQEGLRREGRRE